MDTTLLSTIARLSDDALLSCVKRLAARERETTAVLIAHLAELEERHLYLGEGCSSLFAYCTQILHLSESAAYARIQAARAARRFPVLLEELAEGALTLTTLGLLAPHLTEANHREVLERAHFGSKRQVEELVAQLHPRPPVPASVRRLPSSQRVTHEPSEMSARRSTEMADEVTALVPDLGPTTATPLPKLMPSEPVVSSRSTKPATVEPLAPEQYKVQVTVDKETYDNLRFAQALLRHQIPDGSVATIFSRALGALLEDLLRQKVAATDRPRGDNGSDPHSRHIPAAVKRAVWQRDCGRCAFVSRTGRRCTEDAFLEFHHVEPYAHGGEATVGNIELRCRAHNRYEAEQIFGRWTTQAVREAEVSFTSKSAPPSGVAGSCRPRVTGSGPSYSSRMMLIEKGPRCKDIAAAGGSSTERATGSH